MHALAIILLFGIAVAGNLDIYAIWHRDTDLGQVDIYARGTLAISWMKNDEVYGYFYHLESYSASPTLLFGRNVCWPYTVVKWHAGEMAILNGPCNYNGPNWPHNGSLLLEGQRLFFPMGNFTQIKYDYFAKRLYLYRKPVLYSYTMSDFRLVHAYRMPQLSDFYVSKSKIFYATTNGSYVYDEETAEHYGLEDSEEGIFTAYRLYNGAHRGFSAQVFSVLALLVLMLY
jgi:hypothetical protein